jgi:hypothetical protein
MRLCEQAPWRCTKMVRSDMLRATGVPPAYAELRQREPVIPSVSI